MAEAAVPEVRKVAVIGTGVIGAGWAARFLAHGLDVVAWDPAPDAEVRLRAAVDNAWVELPLGDPGVRNGSAAVYDAGRAVVVLFGGSDTYRHSDAKDDLWEWDGAAWSRPDNGDLFSGLYYHRLLFDPSRGQVLLLGRFEPQAWNGLEWTVLPSSPTAPAPRTRRSR